MRRGKKSLILRDASPSICDLAQILDRATII